MVKWKLIFTKQAAKDSKKLESSRVKEKAELILKILEVDPFQSSPSFEKLKGDLSGAYSRRINIQNRIVYQINKEKKFGKIIRMWTHCE
ncbi:MAG: Txe/YoeB family addiction module toxin [bacterium]